MQGCWGLPGAGEPLLAPATVGVARGRAQHGFLGLCLARSQGIPWASGRPPQGRGEHEARAKVSSGMWRPRGSRGTHLLFLRQGHCTGTHAHAHTHTQSTHTHSKHTIHTYYTLHRYTLHTLQIHTLHTHTLHTLHILYTDTYTNTHYRLHISHTT